MKKLILAAALFATSAWAAAPVLKSPIATMEQLPVVLMQPYDEHAKPMRRWEAQTRPRKERCAQ